MQKLIHPRKTLGSHTTFSLTDQQNVTAPHPKPLLGHRPLSPKVKAFAGPEASSRQSTHSQGQVLPLWASRPHTQTKDSVLPP